MFSVEGMGDVSMKKIICLIMSVIMSLLCLSGCGSKKNDTILLKGVYLLNPAPEIEFISEEVGDGKQYLITVYDIDYKGSSNQEISGWDDAVELTINDENKYEIDIPSYGNLDDFIELSGYTTLDDIDEILGGTSKAIRVVSAFMVNSNDIKEGNKFNLKFDISEDITSEIDFEYENIKQIELLDEIFDTEDNPQAYQVARSIATRAMIAEEYLDDDAFMGPDFIWVNVLSALNPFGKYEKMSVGSSSETDLQFSKDLNSDKLKALNVDDVKLYYPEIADEVEKLMNCYVRIPKERVNDYNLMREIADETISSVNAILEYFDLD